MAEDWVEWSPSEFGTQKPPVDKDAIVEVRVISDGAIWRGRAGEFYWGIEDIWGDQIYQYRLIPPPELAREYMEREKNDGRLQR